MARHARALRPRTATLNFLSRTPILGLVRASADGLGLFSSSTLWMRYCALRCRASSESTFSTLAYANGAVDARSSSILGSWRSNDGEEERGGDGRGRGSLGVSFLQLLAVWPGTCAPLLLYRPLPAQSSCRLQPGTVLVYFCGIIGEIMRALISWTGRVNADNHCLFLAPPSSFPYFILSLETFRNFEAHES